METNYRITKTTTSLVNYHIVFCSRRRQKIFDIEGVGKRFKEIVKQICERNQFNLFAIECGGGECYIHLEAPPTYSPHEVIKIIKTTTATTLKKEFDLLAVKANLWTRCYFVSTENYLPQNIIDNFVKSQRTR